jgi:hypothetical protein
MATTITPTKIAGVFCAGAGVFEAHYECTADTTTAAGLLTMDVTDDFSRVFGMKITGFKAAECEEDLRPLTPGYDVDASATNVGWYVYDAAGASIDSTDVSDTLGTFYVEVKGKRAVN